MSQYLVDSHEEQLQGAAVCCQTWQAGLRVREKCWSSAILMRKVEVHAEHHLISNANDKHLPLVAFVKFK